MADHGFDAIHPRSETSRVVVEKAADQPLPAQPSFSLGVATLWWREVRSFYRQRSRIIAALATPLLFWLVLGSGFGRSMQAAGAVKAGYFEFFFPGTVALVVLFTAIFANISVIEDRREGFLLSVLVAPVPRLALVLGKVFGATTVGLLQGLLLLPLAPVLGFSIRAARIPALIAMIFLLAFGLTCLGFCFAWRLNSVSAFHSVMNTILLPMWLLSGALFPLDGASTWVRWVMYVNPLSYGVGGLRHLLYEGGIAHAPAPLTCWVVTIAFSIVSLGTAAVLATSRSQRDWS
jgi:ABC-2 type transport system permease protein